MTALQFGVMLFPDSAIPALTSRMKQAEALGFDQLYLPDHIGDPRGLAGDWYDTWTTSAPLEQRWSASPKSESKSL
ncbi:MAG: hypothetical protein QOF25_5742 [Mycobacterium sp.]|jgi:alkanesulfonate monooxygenase SsuD/methylene tetrahydromethanopterin reductase-like flavin-dependent oxidoreductase (luciferase family)|nr:hypothetical protein [Mycobacterium sp.]